jgi:hypothetical protein
MWKKKVVEGITTRREIQWLRIIYSLGYEDSLDQAFTKATISRNLAVGPGTPSQKGKAG